MSHIIEKYVRPFTDCHFCKKRDKIVKKKYGSKYRNRSKGYKYECYNKMVYWILINFINLHNVGVCLHFPCVRTSWMPRDEVEPFAFPSREA